jgi:demethylmenaquinone methyltransferase/2-methoxy-6-polyprenyl-1,4-benzoquinol methylase
MDINVLAQSSFSRLTARVMGPLMDNSFRRSAFPAGPILQGAGLHPDQKVLEIGCGSGFFTLPAARVLSSGTGSLTAVDPFAEAVSQVKNTLAGEGLRNVNLLHTDALNTSLPDAGFDLILLFGVLPSPTFNLDTLLPEMARLLKPGGQMAVWPPFFWLPRWLTQNRVFKYKGKNRGVFIFTLPV